MTLTDSLDRICPACLAATSQASWTMLHACALMRRLLADYERRVRNQLGDAAEAYLESSR